MLKGNDLFSGHNIVANIQALNVTFFESVCQLLDVVHNDEIAANVQVFQRVVLLSDHFAELSRRLARYLSV